MPIIKQVAKYYLLGVSVVIVFQISMRELSPNTIKSIVRLIENVFILSPNKAIYTSLILIVFFVTIVRIRRNNRDNIIRGIGKVLLIVASIATIILTTAGEGFRREYSHQFCQEKIALVAPVFPTLTRGDFLPFFNPETSQYFYNSYQACGALESIVLYPKDNVLSFVYFLGTRFNVMILASVMIYGFVSLWLQFIAKMKRLVL